jgi:transcriptional regulator with AAA-type ATPase domain
MNRCRSLLRGPRRGAQEVARRIHLARDARARQLRRSGNVRALQQLVERGVIVAEDGGLDDVGHLFRCGDRGLAPRNPRPPAQSP